MKWKVRNIRQSLSPMTYEQEAVAALKTTRWAGKDLKVYDITDSTNVRAAAEAESGAPHGTLVVADMQTAGKGRRGREWQSPAGSNLYFSLVLKPEFAADRASMLTIVMAHSVNRAIRQETGLDCGIKWPNDIVAGGRKVCGILTEMKAEKGCICHVVIGVGINVGKQEFASELSQTASSLENICGFAISRSSLLARILTAFEEDYEAFTGCGSLKNLMDSYNRMLVNRNAQVRVLDPQGEYEGTALGITETGELLVEKREGEIVEVYAGEVSVRGIYGYV